MADKKISDLTAAIEMLNSNLAAIVQAGETKKITRELFLTAGSGQGIDLDAGTAGTHAGIVGGLGQGYCLVTDNGELRAASSVEISMGLPDRSAEWKMDSAGAWTLTAGSTATGLDIFASNNVRLIIDLTSDSMTLFATGQMTISYHPLTVGDWASTPPSEIADAIDRIASLVRTLNGGTPIP